MNNRKYVWTIFGTAALCCCLLMILTLGCDKKTEKPAPAAADTEKPATESPGDDETDVNDENGENGDSEAETPVSTTPSVNNVCPIMGTKIDPAKVPENLTRTWKGQKVGFCCAGCPVTWDKLSDTDKDAKLAKVLIK